MCGFCDARLSRRGLLAGLAAVSLTGCSENAATGRRQLVLVSDSQLAEMADAPWAEIVAQAPPVRDPDVQARLARIGRPLTLAANRPDLKWSFTVLESPELNAFVLPNGRVGFFKGLLDLARSDDEVASVLGHEIPALRPTSGARGRPHRCRPDAQGRHGPRSGGDLLGAYGAGGAQPGAAP